MSSARLEERRAAERAKITALLSGPPPASYPDWSATRAGSFADLCVAANRLIRRPNCNIVVLTDCRRDLEREYAAPAGTNGSQLAAPAATAPQALDGQAIIDFEAAP